MMRERGSDNTEETFVIDLPQEIYLSGRDDPIRVNSTFELRKEMIDKDCPVADVMSIATKHLLATIDVVSEHRYILSDSRDNKFIFMTSELQAVSILAPDEETVRAAMEG